MLRALWVPLLISCSAAKSETPAQKRSLLILPDINTDPNEGETFGILPVWMMKNVKGEVRRIYAPSLNYNKEAGVTGTFRLFDYPADEAEMELIASMSQENNMRFVFDYVDRGYAGSRYLIGGRIEYSQDGFARFYGIGPDTRESAESNFSRDQLRMEATIGAYLFSKFRIDFSEKFRLMDVERGLLNDLPDTRQTFSNVSGTNGAQVWTHEAALTFDGRDNGNIPSEGILAKLSGTFAIDELFGQVDYEKVALDFRLFHSWGSPDRVTAVRLNTEAVAGDNIPFFELPALGGSETLRAYGADRITDRVRVLFNLEQRFIVHRRHVFGLDAEFEVSPFIDVGIVAADYGRLQIDDIKPVIGLGLRGLTRPDVVGAMDIGIGEEGVQVFLGLGYVF